ncbi:heterokaryon incompatibility protein [Rutstroemia sp. NJR-2017a BBW]|nr:heterokaryon incompatibility protein [Rutstroemia sp. NJR-2017a BBW]
MYTLSSCMELVKQEIPGGYLGIGKILDPSWIDSSLLQQWKRTCDKQHRLACRSTFSSHDHLFPNRPRWLIDIRLQCLSHAPIDADYVALSYVWGSTNCTTVSSTNLEQLQRANSLSMENGRFIIPRTIRDAMILTELLGERYLWVDSLCVVQDDEELHSDELNKMASIYANASVTIVAEHGTHADFGLKGLQSCRPRNLIQRITKFSPDDSILETNCDAYRPVLYPSAWGQRGWTFQEYIFSNRLLIFGFESARWECNETIWYEDREEVDVWRQRRSNDPHLVSKIFRSSIPEMRLFVELVQGYMRRKLTYSEDRLRAFAGMLRVLESHFDGGFVCGLPVLWLDTALLWQPAGVSNSCYAGQSGGKHHSQIPSWSWATATEGLRYINIYHLIEYRQDCLHVKYLERNTGYGLQIYPIVEWGIRERVTSTPTMLPSTWFEYKRQAEEENKLPPGWEKHDGSASTEDQSQLNRNIYYTHDSQSHIHYSYPIPRRDGKTPMAPKGTLLSCYTKRGWLQLAETVPVTIPRKRGGLDYVANWTVLRTMNGTWAGALNFQSPEQETSSISDSMSDSSDASIAVHLTTIELVAISKGCTVRMRPNLEEWRYLCPELDHEGVPNIYRENPYEFYNCLWVEWKDGIAYRKALGRVEKSMWEGLELEEIELILG